MRTFFTYIAMVILVILLYKFNIFAVFAHKSALFFAILLVIGVFIAATRILGTPLTRKDNDDENHK